MPPKQRARNFGSNYTTFRYAGRNIAYLEQVSDSGVQPVGSGAGPGFDFIHPLGYRHPIEIVTSRAHGGGTLQLAVRELWNEEVWEQMAGLAGTQDIIEVFERLAAQPNYVECTKIINPPDGRRYGKTYHRCTIVGIPSGEVFDIGTLSQVKTITVAYTHSTRF